MKITSLRNPLILLLPFLLTGCFKTRQDIAREREEAEVRSNLQQNLLEYNQNMEKANAEIGRLQGRIEELEHQRKKEIGGIVTNRESDQKTIEDLKTKLGSMQEAQNALFEEIKRLKEENLAAVSGSRSAPTPAPSSGSKKKIAPSFESAISSYKSKDYESAVAGFRGYLEANPKGKKAVDARFFLGDSLFKQKAYEQAAVEFGSVHEKVPNTVLGRKSTLRLAQCFKAMGKTKDAHAFAQLLIQSSPESEEAKVARKMLK